MADRLTLEQAQQYPLVAFIEPFRKHARRIEVRDDDGTAVVVRFDIRKHGEVPVAWRCVNRSPEWFMAFNGGEQRPPHAKRWVKP